MTVFKTFLKILNKNKFIVIMYTAILLGFGMINAKSNTKKVNFDAVKPSVLIVNNDEEVGITKNFIDYISSNCEIKEIKDNEDDRNDALFYEEVNYIIYIPNSFHKDFMNGKINEINIKKTDNYSSSYAEMLVKRYLSVATNYKKIIEDEDDLIKKIDETLNQKIGVTIKASIDTSTLNKAAYYFNFASYSLLACLIYIICMILSIFNSDKIKKRNIISSTNYKKSNLILLLSNSLYAFCLWLIYTLASLLFIGSSMISIHGLLFVLNTFLFTFTATSLAFAIGSLNIKKEAISGIMNVVALGSSFLCGAFVPQNYLPDIVIKIAKIFPTSYFIESNNVIATLEKINFNTLKPIIINMIILICFAIIFIIVSNVISKKKQKIA